jgi:hypothetical protein
MYLKEWIQIASTTVIEIFASRSKVLVTIVTHIDKSMK